MKWIVVSDNHGLVEPLEVLKLKYPSATGLIHCGDSELSKQQLDGFFAVLGNNDEYHAFPEYLILKMNKHRALVVHGHRVGITQRSHALAKLAKLHQCDLVFFGHTHVFSDEIVHGVRVMNPGSIWRSRDGRGKTYGIFEIDEHDVMTFTLETYS